MRDKSSLRDEFLSIRKNIDNKKEKSEIIKNKLTSLDCYKNSSKVAVYLNLKNEVETKNLISKMILEGKEVYLPCILDNSMEFYKITSLNEVVNKNSFGILEPEISEDKKLDKETLDLIFVPGICFDTNKNRVGFGKGYYDKYLDKCITNKIGICFDEQILKYDIIVVDKYDVAMDMIVTEEKIYK